jgi:hypothetical protein
MTVSYKKMKNIKQQLIYIGPSLAGNKLTQYTVFLDGYPNHLDDIFEVHPHIKSLFVGIENFTDKCKERDTTGTPLNKYYKEIMEV